MEQPLFAEHRGGTNRVRNDRSRNRRTHVNVVSKTGQAMTRNLFMLEEPWVLDLAKQHGLRDVVEEQHSQRSRR